MASFFPPNTMVSLAPENKELKVEIIEIKKEEIKPILSECQICRLEDKELKTMPCCIGKKVCAECLFEMRYSNCPFCRENITIEVESIRVMNWEGLRNFCRDVSDLIKFMGFILISIGISILTLIVTIDKYKEQCCLHEECKPCPIESDQYYGISNLVIMITMVLQILFIQYLRIEQLFIFSFIFGMNIVTVFNYHYVTTIKYYQSYTFFNTLFYSFGILYVLYQNKDCIKDYLFNCCFRNEYQNIDDINSYTIYTNV